MHEELLVPFLRGVGPDAGGRFHADILKFSDEELEETHDYIQWLFPLAEPSMAVPGSPYLADEEVISILRGDEDVQENIVNALVRMERFYRDTDHWLQRDDHNHLRITRILKSVTLLSSRENARDFYNVIMRRVKDAQPVSDESLGYWMKSVERKEAMAKKIDGFGSKNLLIAGRTGSGKSNFLHTLIADLTDGHGPEQVGLVLIDPKRVEFSAYRELPYLVTDIVYDAGSAKRMIESLLTRPVGYPNVSGPSHVYVIADEFADLMAGDAEFFEDAFVRLAKDSEYTGIYVILASSKTMSEVFTPALLRGSFERIAFRVSHETDSELILGEAGAENLTEAGSCLIRSLSDGSIVPYRIRSITSDIGRARGR